MEVLRSLSLPLPPFWALLGAVSLVKAQVATFEGGDTAGSATHKTSDLLCRKAFCGGRRVS